MIMRLKVLRTAAVVWGSLVGMLALGASHPALAQDDKALTIGVIELFPNPHFAHARKGIEDFARVNNTNVIIQNANLDATKEAQYIQTFITRKVDAILLSAVSPTGSLAALRPRHRSISTTTSEPSAAAGRAPRTCTPSRACGKKSGRSICRP